MSHKNGSPLTVDHHRPSDGDRTAYASTTKKNLMKFRISTPVNDWNQTRFDLAFNDVWAHRKLLDTCG